MEESRDIPRAEAFRATFDNAPIGNAIAAPDGSWQRVNAALADLLGYSVEELQTTSCLAHTYPGDLAATHEAPRQLLAGERESSTLEKRLVAKDGHTIWVHVTTRAQRDATTGAKQLLSYFIDITERKNADLALIASEVRYRRLFESAKDGILILDADTGLVVDVNPFMTELTGFSRDEFLGKHLWQLGPFEDIAASKVSFAELQAKDYVRYEDLPLKTHAGREVQVEFVSNVYLVNDRRVIQCNIRDITARKSAETERRLLERAIEAASQGIVITDPTRADNPVIYASPGFTRLTGYESEEIVGRNCRFLQGPGTDPALLSTLRAAIREARACEVELLNFRKDGASFWNNVAVTPIRASSNVVMCTGIGLVQLDVRCLNGQFAAFGHGVARVDRKVHDDLLDLAGVGFDVPEPAPRERRQVDVGPEQPAEHLLHPGESVVQVQYSRIEHLLPAEGEELPREVRRAHSSRPDLLDVRAQGLAGLEIASDHLGVAEDHGQEVIEIVRDAARESPDSLHLLRLKELSFQTPPSRYVRLHTDEVRHSTIGVPDRRIRRGPLQEVRVSRTSRRGALRISRGTLQEVRVS